MVDITDNVLIDSLDSNSTCLASAVDLNQTAVINTQICDLTSNPFIIINEAADEKKVPSNLADLLSTGADQINFNNLVRDSIIKHGLLVGQAVYMLYALTVCTYPAGASVALTLFKDKIPYGQTLDVMGQAVLGICMGGSQASFLSAKNIIVQFGQYALLKPLNDVAIESSLDTVSTFYKGDQKPAAKNCLDNTGSVSELGQDILKRGLTFKVKDLPITKGIVGESAVLGVSYAIGNPISHESIELSLEKVFVKYGVCNVLYPYFTKQYWDAASMVACVALFKELNSKIVKPILGRG